MGYFGHGKSSTATAAQKGTGAPHCRAWRRPLAYTPSPGMSVIGKNHSLVGKPMRLIVAVVVAATAACFSPEPAHAASTLDGASMGWPWTVPFIGLLLSIATGPLL